MHGLILSAARAILELVRGDSSAGILVRYFGFHTCMLNCHSLIPHLSLIIRWICRMGGGILLLAELLDADSRYVRRAAAVVLHSLAWENKETGNQVVTF